MSVFRRSLYCNTWHLFVWFYTFEIRILSSIGFHVILTTYACKQKPQFYAAEILISSTSCWLNEGYSTWLFLWSRFIIQHLHLIYTEWTNNKNSSTWSSPGQPRLCRFMDINHDIHFIYIVLNIRLGSNKMKKRLTKTKANSDSVVGTLPCVYGLQGSFPYRFIENALHIVRSDNNFTDWLYAQEFVKKVFL